jgi:GNAT superfamily N-acetyltransferase
MPDPSQPNRGTVTIRHAVPADAMAISMVHALCWHQAYTDLLPAALLASVTAERRLSARRQVMADASVTSYIADVGGDIVGFADCGPQREAGAQTQGEVYALYVLQPFQQRQVGLRLFSRCARTLLEQGFKSMHLWCLESNARARRFYDTAGGQLAGRRDLARGAIVLTEVEYRWSLAGMNGLAAAGNTIARADASGMP